MNPSPFMFLLTSKEVSLVGSSPEIMVRVENGDSDDPPFGGDSQNAEPPKRGRRPGCGNCWLTQGARPSM